MHSATTSLGQGRRWPRLVLLAASWLALWTMMAAFDIVQTYLLLATYNPTKHVSPGFIIGQGLSLWYLWALLAPLLLWLGLRCPLVGPSWRRHLAIQCGASLALSVAKIGIDTPLWIWFRSPEMPPAPAPWEAFKILFFGRLLAYLIICALVLGAALIVAYYRKFREGELQASRLAAQLAEAQLQVLKMQLHPHFLFNTLHAISALVHKDVDLADRMIARLGELLRSTLENAGTQEVPLRDELEFIKPYLEIEQARLGPRLTVSWDIDPETMDAQVPNLLLQPLVENAIRHGIAPRSGDGTIEIAARRDNGHLHLQVRDNGRGLATNYTEGVGVANTRARLRQLYGAAHRFEMNNRPSGGLEVTVAVPFSTTVAEEPA